MRTSDRDLFFFVQTHLLRRMVRLHDLQFSMQGTINRFGPDETYVETMQLYRKQFAECLRWLKDLDYDPSINPKHKVRLVVKDLYDLVHQAIEESISDCHKQTVQEFAVTDLVSRNASQNLMETIIAQRVAWLQLISR